MARFFLNSFKPLAYSRFGRMASEKYEIPPFVDGSIRREPDLEHERPSISCLCRTNKFAPRLQAGDLVAYMTCKAKYGSDRSHRRMIAALRVDLLFESHVDAAMWYRSQSLPLPSNCMVMGNGPCPLDHSHRIYKSKCNDTEMACGWDRGYARRADRYGRFVVCTCLWKDLGWSAPIIQDRFLVRAFGKVPATRNPAAFRIETAPTLFEALGITIPPLVPPSSR